MNFILHLTRTLVIILLNLMLHASVYIFGYDKIQFWFISLLLADMWHCYAEV